ncbi:hypothetical protein [Sporosarcina koreensis]|uniref:hypothetical protein n=1 Tax=Sporosarcina koreensis TaxID=334735 RepID=UPI000590C194|nr:hypothetical protein [Sporosarcina koreensis]
MIAIVSIDDFDFLEAGESGQAAKLAVFGSVVSLIGDAITTYAAALAIEEQKQSPDNSELLQEMRELKQQLTAMSEEMRHSRGAADRDRSAGSNRRL